jgi:phytoene dehydrogenase-like protein
MVACRVCYHGAAVLEAFSVGKVSLVSDKPVIVIGAGLAGLSCARHLDQRGIAAVLVEAQDGVGGRVRTDLVDGFQLDRGFQVLQTAYPEARRQLDYAALGLHNFAPGALIQTGGRVARMSDPWRRPSELLSTLFNGVGTFSDRLKLARLRFRVTRDASLDGEAGRQTVHSGSPTAAVGAAHAVRDQQLVAGDRPSSAGPTSDLSTEKYLQQVCGFSEDMIERFFRPWFSGVFLERDLATSSRFFQFLFRMFATGDAALPAGGMGAIPQQLAACLPPSAIRLSTRVRSFDAERVQLDSGEVLPARAVVLAVEGPEAARLTNGAVPEPISNSTLCYYYAAPAPPLVEPLLVLNGDGRGPINHLCVPSNVCPQYAPRGQALISVSIVGQQPHNPQELQQAVRNQLRDWYGSQVDGWQLLRSDSIRHALPRLTAFPTHGSSHSAVISEGIYRCGDYCETGSIHGAMLSGRRAAEALLHAWGLSEAAAA